MTPKFDMSLVPPDPDLSFECALWEAGIYNIAGIDEAGRGPIAGPVAAAAVILPPDPDMAVKLKGVRDSKQMTADDREYWAGCLKILVADWGVGFASAEEIDQSGIISAIRLAVARALSKLVIRPEHLLLDYLRMPDSAYPQTALIKGDSRCISIAAASILAKTARDAHLCELDGLYPGYGFASNKGYCTPDHMIALNELGPCPIHRYSFRPIKIDEQESNPEEETDE
jgi:ribonuclease HII